MENEHVLSGLMKKRAELAGQIEHTQRQLQQLVMDLDHIDHAIRIIDPQADVSLVKPRQYPARHAAYKGEMQRHVLHCLRNASEPVTSLDIARSVASSRGMDQNDQRAIVLLRKRVGACLYKLVAKGFVREVPQPGEYKGWELVR
ncbi:MAG: hypothetical protein GC201_02185 [Alphaproteobacteria bacterium]|nr:hypothetical protein [Alphaproteobacteria bacterium]